MSGEGQQQQQQQQQQQPNFDINAVVGSLSQENRDFAGRKGWVADGKATDGFKLDAVFDSYRGLETKIGQKTLMPPDLSSPEAFAKWEGHALLGVPEKPEDYKLEKPALPDGLKWGTGEGEIPWDEKAEKEFRAVALKHKVGGPQAQAMFADFVASRMAGILENRASRANEKAGIEANLQKSFGTGLKGALETGNQAVAAIAKAAGLEPSAAIDALASSMGNEQATRFAIQLGKMMAEDTLKGGGLNNGFASGVDGAKAEIAKMESDPETIKALFDKKHPSHQALTEKRNRLYAQANPQG